MQGKTDISVKDAAWFQAKGISLVFSALKAAGGDAAIVGGAVRNHLLGKPVGDVDFATTLPPDETVKAAKTAGVKAIPTGFDHGTITLVVAKETFEVTTLRRDVKTDGRRAVVEYGKDWLEDAQRRDFTCNALYVDETGQVFDPLNAGIEDTALGLIRFIGDPRKRIREDHLRTLRAFRFAAHYAKVPLEQEALSAMMAERTGLHTLSNERVRDEFIKLLQADNLPAILNQMRHAGLLALLLQQAPNTARLEKYMAIEKSLNLPPDPIVRLGVLTLYHTGDVVRMGKRFALSKADSKAIGPLVDLVSFPALEINETTIKKHKIAHYLRGKSAYLTAFKGKWLQSRNTSKDETVIKLYQEALMWPEETFPLKGADLIREGLAPGPEMGAQLKELEALWLEADMKLTAKDLLQAFAMIIENRKGGEGVKQRGEE